MNFKTPAVAALSTVALVSSINAAKAEVKLAPIFTDNMVLQRDKPIPVWGTAKPGEKVEVTLMRQSITLHPFDTREALLKTIKTTADANGNWKVALEATKYSQFFVLYELDATIVNNKTDSVKLKNIAVGDVYICSGQSNMEWPLSQANDAQAEIASAKFPNIRLLTVPKKIAATPQKEFAGATNWQVCSPETIPGFSAVAYFFGREINQKTGVPIGLINASWGGTIAQAWMSKDALVKRDDLRALTLQTEGNPPDLPNQPTVLFNGMIAPLLGFPSRGAIWYQGESNAERATQYQTLFPELIKDWRAQWNAKQDGSEFGFYFVQLANYMARTDQPVESGWAELREAQTLALSTPRTGMATTIDIGEGANIHPKNKQDVGKRLALVALAKEYGQKLEYSGPMFSKMEKIANTNRVRISFAHAKNLTVKNVVIQVEYPDVPLGHWAYVAFSKLAIAGIFEGYPSGMNGGRAMTRYEFAVTIARLMENIHVDADPAKVRGQVNDKKILHYSDWNAEMQDAFTLLKTEFIPELNQLGVRTENFPDRIQEPGRAPKLTLSPSVTKPQQADLSAAVMGSFQKPKPLGAFVKGFAVRGEDGNWFWAEAHLDGDSVVLWSDEVLQPVAVRYAWANNPDVNLVNAAGLPAVPFRTDVAQ